MARRFTLAELLLWVTFVALVLAIVGPLWQANQRRANAADMVISVAASADGSTAAAMMGDGRVLIWDATGNLKTTLPAKGGWGGSVQLSADGKFAAVARELNAMSMQPKGGIELWDVGAGKLRQILPASFMAHLAFSPQPTVFAVVDENAVELRSLANEAPSGAIVAGGNCARFSPDGKMIAVATRGNGVQIYDVATRKLVRKLDAPDNLFSWHYFDLAWSPDGRTLAGLCMFTDDGLETIQTWRVQGVQAKSATLPDDDSFESLTYLPGGRFLALAGVRSGMTLLDAATLDPSTAKRSEQVSEVAAGARGETFVAAGAGNIDVWDAATLRPRRRLFDAAGAPSPNIVPGLLGLFAWLIVFGVRRARALMRSCQICGQQFQVTDKKDQNTDCPRCRQKARLKLLTCSAADREQRKQIRGNWARLALFDVVLADLVGFVANEWLGFWPAFLVATVAIPITIAGLAYLIIRFKVAGKSAGDIARADKAAGTTGTRRQIGDMLVWSAQGTSLAETLPGEIELARQRLESVIGRTVPAPNARVFIFDEDDALARYVARLTFVQLDPRFRFQSLYLAAPARRLLVAERDVRRKCNDPRIPVRISLGYHLLERVDGRMPAAWIVQGLSSVLSHDDEHHELARLNRRVFGCA
ncbi:MAG: hypothetical protein B7X10_00770, partial [Burkholderiales bacterium 21-58-4]